MTEHEWRDPDPSEFVSALLRGRKDLIPGWYGEIDALEQSGSTATPLLAGFALTMASLVLTSAHSFRLPDIVLVLLTVSVVSLVMSVQAAQWTRTFRVRPEEVQAWWPKMNADQRESCILDIREHHHLRKTWARRQRLTYRLGLLALLSGFAVALVPPDSVSVMRWVAFGVGCFGFALELLWIAANE